MFTVVRTPPNPAVWGDDLEGGCGPGSRPVPGHWSRMRGAWIPPHCAPNYAAPYRPYAVYRPYYGYRRYY